jgi:hypothetical protein
MASILDRYGIKEVADVVFYEIDATGNAGKPVLYLDSLKVSTLEQTAETVYAQGGKGNPRLIGWDFGKEITLSLEDALFSPKSMALMFGDGNVDEASTNTLIKTEYLKAENNEKISAWKGVACTSEYFSADGKFEPVTTPVAGTYYYVKMKFTFDSINGMQISIGPDSFPGTYYITGDTYARSEITGKDECFQFVVYKGKVTSENSITMEAEGDPSVFNMTVDVLRATINGENKMMELIKYSFED